MFIFIYIYLFISDVDLYPKRPDYPNHRITRSKDEAKNDRKKSVPYELSGCTVDRFLESGKDIYIILQGNDCHHVGGNGLNQKIELNDHFDERCEEVTANKYECKNVNINMYNIFQTNQDLGN